MTIDNPIQINRAAAFKLMKYNRYYLILLAFCLTSCYKDVEDVNIRGTVTDSINEKPCKGLNCLLAIWQYT